MILGILNGALKTAYLSCVYRKKETRRVLFETSRSVLNCQESQ
jgi:hypothetical protein